VSTCTSRPPSRASSGSNGTSATPRTRRRKSCCIALENGSIRQLTASRRRLMYRQGDVLVVPITEAQVPAGLIAELRDSGRMVLARGEATGHAHVVTGEGLTLLCLPDDLEAMFLHVRVYGRLSHEEHGPIALPAGYYRVVRQREYVPGTWRPVAD